MNADGSDRKMIHSEDPGVRWSPKRNEIAYITHDGGAANLVIYDVAKEETRSVPLEKDYSEITWGFAWSPDGKWICFKGDRADGRGVEIVAALAEEGKRDFKTLLTVAAHPEIKSIDDRVGCFGPGNDVLVCMRTKTSKSLQPYILDFNGAKPPKPLPGITAGATCCNLACSPDGKKIVFSVNLPNPGETADKPESSTSD